MTTSCVDCLNRLNDEDLHCLHCGSPLLASLPFPLGSVISISIGDDDMQGEIIKRDENNGEFALLIKLTHNDDLLQIYVNEQKH